MITKYRTGGCGKLIEIVEVERETDSSVWINGCRNAKVTGYHCYFDSFEEAKSYLLEKARRKIDHANKMLSWACDKKRELLDFQECDAR